MSETSAPPVLSGVHEIVAVHSAKGGVGKSTVAVGLAATFARLGMSVGLLDADIYGPSIAQMLGSDARPQPAGDGRRIAPLEGHGVRFLSMANVATPDAPIIWRGPMLSGALNELLTAVDWGDLDLLIVDLPPGTGDAILGLSQSVSLSGVVVVTTPQEVSLVDTRRGIQAFGALKVPILGLVENMSGFVCDQCSDEVAIFGEGGGRQTAVTLGLPFLGRIPIVPSVVSGGDEGVPVVVSEPDGIVGRTFASVARTLLVEVANRGRAATGAFDVDWRGDFGDRFLASPPGGDPAPEPGPSRPLRVWQATDDALGVRWSDGATTFHGAYELRRACPCAGCVEEWTGEKLPSLDRIPADVRPTRVKTVGRYALQPTWTDGHHTGIYSFDELRRGAGQVPPRQPEGEA